MAKKKLSAADHPPMPPSIPEEPELERIEDLTAALQGIKGNTMDTTVKSAKKSTSDLRSRKGEQGRTPYDALRFYSALTHFIGMALSIVGLVILVVVAARVGTVWHVVGFSIYGACMILLYATSAFYHSLRLPPKGRNIMRKLDHTMIYVFIAGAYTPLCFLPLHGAWGWSMFGVLWGLAIAGIIFKNIWITAPRWLSVVSYLLMGWMAVICIYPLIQSMPSGGMFWLFMGGVFYSVGGVFYALKWPNRNGKRFGFHEVFHVLILLGSICHFVMMFRYVMYITP